MEQLLKLIRSLETNKLVALVGIFLSVLGFLFYFVNLSNTPDMALLYSNLEQEEAARVVDKLKNAGIEYDIQANGTQILAPSDKIAELRMDMALNGVVSGGSMGYEIFDRSDVLGTSSAMLNINHMRALEGELAKSIKTIGDVQSARVHLVMPKRELFSKEQISPSASVILRMKSGQRLSSNQIQAVQALITSAVPNMTNDKISIIDDKGSLLARGRDGGGATDSFSTQVTMREEYEEKLSRQIEMLLEKTIGADHVRVEVSAEMDFNRTTTQSVDYDPEGQVARTINTTEEGVSSNDSNAAADAVSIQNAVPDEENKNNKGNESKSSSNKVEETTSFEISNKTTTTVHETGHVKRLSVAVLIDGMYTKDNQGKMAYQERSAEEIKQLTELVQTAIGFKAKRGDVVRVINMKFKMPEELKDLEDDPFWKKWLESFDFKKLVEMIIMGIFSLIIVFNFLKPSLSKIISSLEKQPRDEQNKKTESLPAKEKKSNTTVTKNNVSTNDNDTPQSVIIHRQQQAPQRAGPQIIFADGQPDNFPQDMIASYGGGFSSNKNSQPLDEFDDTEINIDQIEGSIKSSTLNRISNIAEQNPDETVSLLRSWLYEER